MQLSLQECPAALGSDKPLFCCFLARGQWAGPLTSVSLGLLLCGRRCCNLQLEVHQRGLNEEARLCHIIRAQWEFTRPSPLNSKDPGYLPSPDDCHHSRWPPPLALDRDVIHSFHIIMLARVPECLGSNPISATYYLCDLEQVTWVL